LVVVGGPWSTFHGLATAYGSPPASVAWDSVNRCLRMNVGESTRFRGRKGVGVTERVLDLHPIFRDQRALDNALRRAVLEAAAAKVARLKFIPGKGSGQLKVRVLTFLAQPHIKRLYRRVESGNTNAGVVYVIFSERP
jgi:hypothetical protein